MKTIDVKPQPKLSLARTVQVTLNGIRYRMFRSAVTMAVIAVAVAFLMNVMCEAVTFRAVGRAAIQRAAELQLADRWAARLSGVGSLEVVLEDVAAASGQPGLAEEMTRFGGLNAADFPEFQRRCGLAREFTVFLDQVGFARRRVLVGETAGAAALARLSRPGEFAKFAAAVKAMRTVRLPAADEAMADLTRTWPETEARLRRILAERNRAAVVVAGALQGRTPAAALAGARGPFGAAVADAGFSSFTPDLRARVAAQADDALLARRIEDLVQQPDLRKIMAGILDVMPRDVNARVLWEAMAGRAAAEKLVERMREKNCLPEGATAARIMGLARLRQEQQDWNEALRLTRETVSGGGFLGIGPRMTWLVLVSLLVCAVGITNAMLMSVTERFREIATLKCLGALDGFIMCLFLLEAALLGLAGGLVGGLAGSVVGFGRMAFQFGGLLWVAFPVGPWLISGLLAILAGMLLAAVAGVYPSYLAARLAPMEAMRIE